MQGKIVKRVKMGGGNVENMLELRMSYRPHVDGNNTGIAGKLHIGNRIANHQRLSKVDLREIPLGLHRHSDVGLAASTGVRRKVGTAVDPVEGSALHEELALHTVVYVVDVLLRAETLAHALLVGDQDDSRKAGTQDTHRLKEVRDIDKLLWLHHIATYNLLIHHAVAVHKKGPLQICHRLNIRRQKYKIISFFVLLPPKTYAGQKEARMKRTPLAQRLFPNYTSREEMLNMTSHIVGAVCALVMIVLALQTSIRSHSALSVVCAALYTTCVLITFVVSSVYHGLPKGKGKQVMRVIDHCDIFFTIAGTYTPIALLSIRSVNPTMGWVIFGIEWALALLGATLNAIDLKKYSKFSMACYLGMGWCVVISLRDAITGMTMNGFLWLLWGGLAFTIGAVLYLIGKKKRYIHFVFHIFVVIGIVLQFIGIWRYVL